MKVAHNLSQINLDKCRVCDLCVPKCPTKAIVDFIPVHIKAFFMAEKCIGCNMCKKVCPVNMASGELKQKHTVVQSKFIGCAICTVRCPVHAIDGTNAAEVL